MKKAWLYLADRFDARTPRERLMITVAAVAVLAGIFHFTVFAPALARYDAAQAALRADTWALRALEASEVALVGAASRAPAAANGELETAQAELRAFEDRLGRDNAHLVDPAQAVDMLRSLITARKGLELVSLQAGEVVDLLASSAPGAVASAPALPLRSLYQHTLKLALRGDYSALNRYVGELEALSWQPRIAGLQLVTEAWPQARMELTLHITSMERAWLAF